MLFRSVEHAAEPGNHERHGEDRQQALGVGAAADAAAQMASACDALARACGQPTTSFTRLSGTATIDGVAFFDFAHGQRGASANQIELHPVLRFSPGPERC